MEDTDNATTTTEGGQREDIAAQTTMLAADTLPSPNGDAPISTRHERSNLTMLLSLRDEFARQARQNQAFVNDAMVGAVVPLARVGESFGRLALGATTPKFWFPGVEKGFGISEAMIKGLGDKIQRLLPDLIADTIGKGITANLGDLVAIDWANFKAIDGAGWDRIATNLFKQIKPAQEILRQIAIGVEAEYRPIRELLQSDDFGTRYARVRGADVGITTWGYGSRHASIEDSQTIEVAWTLCQVEVEEATRKKQITKENQGLLLRMKEWISLEELEVICYIAGVDYEELGEGGLTLKVCRAIKRARRLGLFQELVTACRRVNPSQDWTV